MVSLHSNRNPKTTGVVSSAWVLSPTGPLACQLPSGLIKLQRCRLWGPRCLCWVPILEQEVRGADTQGKAGTEGLDLSVWHSLSDQPDEGKSEEGPAAWNGDTAAPQGYPVKTSGLGAPVPHVSKSPLRSTLSCSLTSGLPTRLQILVGHEQRDPVPTRKGALEGAVWVVGIRSSAGEGQGLLGPENMRLDSRWSIDLPRFRGGQPMLSPTPSLSCCCWLLSRGTIS